MNIPRFTLRVLSLLLPVALSAAPVKSTLSAVTVYQDRAIVTRTATAELPVGVTELTFENLPAALNEQSLQVTGKGTAQAVILDVSAHQAYVDFTPNTRVHELEEQLRALAKQRRALDDRKSVLDVQSALFTRMEATLFAPPSKDVPRPELNQLTTSLTYLTEQKSKLISEQAGLDEQREDLQAKQEALEAQLNEVRGAGGRSYKTVTVRVSAAQAGNLDVALSYTVPGASWSPSYDARVLSAEHTVALGYFGLVRQNTGEDWKDVALTLSTARPGFGGSAPSLSSWNLDVWLPRPLAEAYKGEAGKRKSFSAQIDSNRIEQYGTLGVNLQRFTSNAPEGVSLGGYAAPAPVAVVADVAEAVVSAEATSAVFKITTPATILSDNSPQKIPVTTVRLAADPEYLTVPKRQAAAFLTAKVVNAGDFPLLAGAMNVFLDGTFVANSQVRSVMPGEKFDLALGAEEGISVKHRRVQRFAEDTGLTNSGKRITFEYAITVQNNKKTAARVIIVDQLPLSHNEKIVVKQLAPEAKDVKPTDEGTLKWSLDLAPGEKRDIPVKFSVEYPNDVTVTGLD